MVVVTVRITADISTHALREEGDKCRLAISPLRILFLPTPSARRATSKPLRATLYEIFLPTPSARRATRSSFRCIVCPDISTHALREEGDEVGDVGFTLWDISTHALREEGDPAMLAQTRKLFSFLPTPSARRATRGPI